MAWRLDEIAARFGGVVAGNGSVMINRVATLEQAGSGDISFLANPKYLAQLASTQASAVILSGSADGLSAAIITDQPYLYFARVAQWLNPAPPSLPGIHPSAAVEGKVDSSASIGANVWIGVGSRVGAGVVIGANCSIGEDVQIGANSHLAANVSVYAACQIGERCLLHSGVVIGADGFGFAREKNGAWVKIPQTGRVLVGDDVEIGAGTTIDRGTLGDTVIGKGVKLDNQIQIAHNVRVGDHVAIAGCVGIAGSATLGARCTIGGGAIILGHLIIADDVNISAGTIITKSIAKAGTYSGAAPFQAHKEWLKNFSHLRRLESMADKIHSLEQRLASLEKKQ